MGYTSQAMQGEVQSTGTEQTDILKTATSQIMPEEELKQVMQTNVQELNTMIPHYSQISRFVIMKDEFEKTPKKSIKRFLYQNAAD